MGLETATYIDGLVVSNPDGSDVKSQGDNHLRLIKNVLKNSFPTITGAITATLAQINNLANPGVVNTPGIIAMWSGNVANIPAGWKLCNGVGTISNGSPVPNLTNRFVYGTDGTAPGGGLVGGLGGSATHTHTISVTPTALTVDQLPPHNHAPAPLAGVPWGLITLGNAGGNIDGGVSGGPAIGPMATVGSGNPHTHGAAAAAGLNIPPYIALAFIIKD